MTEFKTQPERPSGISVFAVFQSEYAIFHFTRGLRGRDPGRKTPYFPACLFI
jgi:hypothetical protein